MSTQSGGVDRALTARAEEATPGRGEWDPYSLGGGLPLSSIRRTMATIPPTAAVVTATTAPTVPPSQAMKTPPMIPVMEMIVRAMIAHLALPFFTFD